MVDYSINVILSGLPVRVQGPFASQQKIVWSIWRPTKEITDLQSTVNSLEHMQQTTDRPIGLTRTRIMCVLLMDFVTVSSFKSRCWKFILVCRPNEPSRSTQPSHPPWVDAMITSRLLGVKASTTFLM